LRVERLWSIRLITPNPGTTLGGCKDREDIRRIIERLEGMI
jgi:hypothetical protein